MSGAAEQSSQPPPASINLADDTPSQKTFHPAQAQAVPGATAAAAGVVFSAGHEGQVDSSATTAGLTASKPGAELGFVRPSDLLRRPRGQSRPMPPLSAVDREQFEGLVSSSPSSACSNSNRAFAEGDSSVPQGAKELRRPASELPPDRFRHEFAGQEEPGHPHPQWHCVGALVGLQDIDIRGAAHDQRLHQRHPVLLAEP